MQDPLLQGVPSPPFCAEHSPRVFAVDVPSRQRGVKKLPKQDWVARIAAFNEGRWLELLREARQVQPPSHDPSLDTPEARADRSSQRARHLVHLGELSAARQALVASPLAPGTVETLQELRDRADPPARPRPRPRCGPGRPSLAAIPFQP